jgi:hypothetical protein
MAGLVAQLKQLKMSWYWIDQKRWARWQGWVSFCYRSLEKTQGKA